MRRAAQLQIVAAAGNLLPDGLLGVERLAALVDIGQLDRLADAQAALVGLLPGPVIRRSRVVLPAPLGPITPTMLPGGMLWVRSSISRRSP